MTKMVKINFVGDILLHSHYNSIANEKDPFFIFEKIFPAFSEANLRFGNLESVLSSKGVPISGKGCISGDEEYVRTLRKLNFDILSLANNHTFDFGFEAYEDMVLRLREAGIKTVGAGRRLSEGRQITISCINNLCFGFLAYSSRSNNGYRYATDSSFGVVPLEEEIIMEDIKKNKNKVDYLIVSLHWGLEHSPYPTPDQISLAHRIVDAGVSVVAGNHPQILQGIEKYKDGYIMYSLGNFCHSDYYWEGPLKTYQFKMKSADRESVMVGIDFYESGMGNIRITPLWINDLGQPEICHGEKGNSIMERLKERSEMIKRPEFDKFWNEIIIKKRVGNPIKIWWENGNLIYKIRNFKFSQIKSLLDLILMYIQVRFSKSPSKWHMFNPRNDKKPKPFCGDE